MWVPGSGSRSRGLPPGSDSWEQRWAGWSCAPPAGLARRCCKGQSRPPRPPVSSAPGSLELRATPPPGARPACGEQTQSSPGGPVVPGPPGRERAASRCPCARRAWLPVKEAGRASCEPAPAGIRHLLLRPEAGAAWGGHRPKGAPPGGGMSPARKGLPPPATACGTSPPALPWPAWTAGAGTGPGDRGEVAPGRRRRSDPRAWVTARGRGLRLRAPQNPVQIRSEWCSRAWLPDTWGRET